jgi:hypothetical protein
MANRKDQVPKGAYGDAEDWDEKEQLAFVGHAFYDNGALMFLTLLENLEQPNKRDTGLETLLSRYFLSIVKNKDVRALRALADKFEIAVERMKPENRASAHDRTKLLTIRFEKTAKRSGKKINARDLVEHLAIHGLHVSDSYARRIRREIRD